MSLSAELCLGTVEAIAARLELEETESVPLTSAMDGSPVGVHRVLARDGVAALVYVAMTVEAFGLDSHMCFAFTPPGSAVPHFTVDSVLAGPHYAFHLDLMPRVDPGASLAYVDHCFVPLSDAHSQAAEIALTGLFGIKATFGTVAAYRDHWLGLAVDGVPDGVLDGATAEQLAERDARHRAALFNPDVDPVWAQVDRLLGPDVSANIRTSLQTAGRT